MTKAKIPLYPPSEKDRDVSEEKLPAVFATIHFRSPRRPDGYTDGEIAEMNRLANLPKKKG